MSVSTHVLDAVNGAPAAGLAVLLEGPLLEGPLLEGPLPDDGRAADGIARSEGVTDADGRISGFALPELPAATYRLTFRTGDWFAERGRETFYPTVTITFSYSGTGHVHVPILLSPYSYTTYRGS